MASRKDEQLAVYMGVWWRKLAAYVGSAQSYPAIGIVSTLGFIRKEWDFNKADVMSAIIGFIWCKVNSNRILLSSGIAVAIGPGSASPSDSGLDSPRRDHLVQHHT